MISCRILICAAAVATLGSVAPALAAPGNAPVEIATNPGAAGSIMLQGQRIDYRASFVRTALSNGAATISGVSYVRTGIAAASSRPIVIAWGGGPGWPSTNQAYRSYGPELLIARENPRLVDNPESILDIADVLVIDAVGTGFSQVSSPSAGAPYWGLKGDAEAFEQLIRGWLKAQNRLSSPLYLSGESYGGTRMGMLIDRIPDLNVAGIILVSPAINLQSVSGDASQVTGDPAWNQGVETDQSFINNLPSYAIAAFSHGRVPQQRRSLEQVFAEARTFAQGPYAEALQLGSSLSPAKRREIAKRMAELTGLPPSVIEQSDLRVMSQAFLDTLLPGQTLSRLDTRVAVPKQRPTLTASDPKMPKSVEDPRIPWTNPADPRRTLVESYLRSLGAPANERFGMGNLEINSSWNWNLGSTKLEDNLAGLTVTPDIARYVTRHPQSRIFLATGYYDAAVPALAPEYSLTHSGIPLDRIVVKRYATGHEIADDDAGRPPLMTDLRRFILHRH